MSSIDSTSGSLVDSSDAFLEMLRPYRGLDRDRFEKLMEALIHTAISVDQRMATSAETAVHCWTTCYLARLTFVAPDSMLRRNNLINVEEYVELTLWIDIFERGALGVVSGLPLSHAMSSYLEYIGSRPSIRSKPPLLNLLTLAIESDDDDVRVAALKAMSKVTNLPLQLLEAAQHLSISNNPEVADLAAKILSDPG